MKYLYLEFSNLKDLEHRMNELDHYNWKPVGNTFTYRKYFVFRVFCQLLSQ